MPSAGKGRAFASGLALARRRSDVAAARAVDAAAIFKTGGIPNDDQATITCLGLALALAIPAAAQAKTFYWISHGCPADPVWTYFLAGAKQWAKDTGNTVNTSFHNGDVPSQQEAVRAAIAAKADGIVTTSPDPGSLVEVAKEANAADIPIINFNTPDPTAELRRLCRRRQRHLRQALGAVPGRQGPGEVGRLRLDAGRSPRRHLWRAGRRRHQERLRAARHHL